MQIEMLQSEKPLSSQLNGFYNQIISGEEVDRLNLAVITERVKK